jgi:hypothetical protein
MDNPKRSRAWLLAGVGALVLAGGAWGTMSFVGRKPATAIASVQDPMKAMDNFRKEMDRKDLTDQERDKLVMNMRSFREEQEEKRVEEYYTAKPEDRTAIINRHIDEMEKWRKEREARMAEEAEKAKADGKSEEELNKEREKRRDEWRKREEGKSREERKAESESRDPNARARERAYRSAMRKQMTARGIEPPRFGGMGGRGGPGGPGGPRG